MMRFIVIAILLTPVFCRVNIRTEEKKILDSLLDKAKYDFRIRPNGIDVNETGTDGPSIVRTNMFIRHIDYVCTKKMEWKVQITFRQQWNDDRLKFDDQNGKIRYLVLEDDSHIWKPDTFFTNSLSSTERMSDIKPNVLLRIYPNGNVLYSIRMNAQLSCPMDLKHYPFDSQTCSLRLASYSYTTDDLIFLWKEGDPVQITKTLNLPGFYLKSYATDYCTSKTNTGEYSCMKLDVLFERSSSEYTCQWFVPTAILTLISFASFWLKPKTCRIRFLVTVLVLLYLHVLYINNRSASNVSYSTAKDCWLSTCLLFVLAAILELAIVKLVESSSRKRTKGQDTSEHNGKTHIEEGDAVAMKPLVEEGKDDQKEEEAKQYTVNKGSDRRNIVQKWKESSIGCRLDMCSAILFPLLFIVYIITFFTYEGLRE